jgi:predicted metal-dependent HD superfamily phosphohydrolase
MKQHQIHQSQFFPATESMNEDTSSLLRMASHVNENCNFDAASTPGLRESLKRHWNSVSTAMAEETSSALHEAWFDRIYEQHNEQGRFYHTAVHLKEMLDYLEVLRQTEVITNEQAVPIILAIFFHDVVYDPKSSQNETESAMLFQNFGNEVSLNPNVSEVVVTMIEATAKHTIVLMADQPEMQSAQAFFLDLDMAVLGKKVAAYLAYAALIRQEFSFVDSETYCSKRAQILQSFMDDSKSIYITEIFQTAMESQARKNLKTEISLLQNGVIPG